MVRRSPTMRAIWISLSPFCSDTTHPSGDNRSANERTAASVAGALHASNTVSSRSGKASGVVAETGTVNVSANPRIVSPRSCMARTWSTSRSTNSTDSPPRTMCAPTVPPIAPAPKTVYVIRLPHRPAEKVERILPGDLADRVILVPARDQPADDVRAVGRRFETIQVRRRQAVRCIPPQQHPMKADVVADLGVGPDPHMVNSHELDEIVVVVEHAVDVLVRVVAERVRDGGHTQQPAFSGAGAQLFVAAGPACRRNGRRRVVAEDDRHARELDRLERRARARVRQVDGHAEVIHPLHDLDPEVTQTAVRALVLPVADRALAHIGQASQPNAHAIQHIS